MNELLTEDDRFGLSPQQRKLANIGRVLMDQAASTKDDNLSNVMAKVGNELTNFGTPFGASNLQELIKKTNVSAEVIQKLLAYGEKIHSSSTALSKDNADSGLDDTDNDDNDFMEPDDAAMAMQALLLLFPWSCRA